MANYTTPIILDIISVIQQGSTMWLTNSNLLIYSIEDPIKVSVQDETIINLIAFLETEFREGGQKIKWEKQRDNTTNHD